MSRQTKTFAPAKCAWCAGTGKQNIAPGKTVSCLVCGGKGHLSIAQPAQSCGECEGSGRRNNLSPCLNCAGTGWEPGRR